MKVIIDGRQLSDRLKLHEHLQKELHFSGYYGKNLDALYDLLSIYFEPVEIELIHVEELKENLGVYAEALIETFQDAASENEKITFLFREGSNKDGDNFNQ